MDLDLSSLGVPRIEVHCANSGRAKCKEFRCRRVIGLGELRCQVNQPGDWPVVILQRTFSRLDALLFTAMDWIFIPAYIALPFHVP